MTRSLYIFIGFFLISCGIEDSDKEAATASCDETCQAIKAYSKDDIAEWRALYLQLIKIKNDDNYNNFSKDLKKEINRLGTYHDDDDGPPTWTFNPDFELEGTPLYDEEYCDRLFDMYFYVDEEESGFEGRISTITFRCEDEKLPIKDTSYTDTAIDWANKQ